MQFIDRRDFLQTAAIIAGSLILPKSLRAGKPDKSFHFIHVDSQNSWPVPNPVQWSLENARQAVLERAGLGLRKLTSNDGDGIIRLVTRRCQLNLLEVHPGQVVVHHWGQQGRADLRPFFKTHRLARKEIEVVIRDRKREVVTTQTGDSFLFGERLEDEWPLDLFLGKWHRRFEQNPDDWTAAPGTRSGYAWEGVEDNQIPWAALNSPLKKSKNP